jgi:hypothetical protein
MGLIRLARVNEKIDSIFGGLSVARPREALHKS